MSASPATCSLVLVCKQRHVSAESSPLSKTAFDVELEDWIAHRLMDDQPPDPDPTGEITETTEPAHVLAARLATVVPGETMAGLLALQDESLATLAATDAELRAFNTFSAARFDGTAARVETHVAMLRTLKADLDNVFKRVRALKTKVAKKYPTQYAEYMRHNVNGGNDEGDE
ncbi:hypothetical protein BC830DRAFT_1085172 [Chytriomyces sp. MP71]|nr:hypothetical protein BC830DRAFT_1085172 [Chytriomyces sp. MP71]